MQALLDVFKPRGKEAGGYFSSLAPPSPEQSRQLAKGLMLDGKPLEPAVFLNPGWKHGQTFTASQDPDRTNLPWQAPSFVQTKDPVQQSKKTWAEDLAVSDSGATFARVVHGILDEADCADLLRCINHKGFTPALLNIGQGRQRFEPDIRNGHRAIVDSQELSAYLLEVLRPHLPEVLDGGFLVDLNERCRVLCYTPGQEFGPHYDACFVRPRGSVNAGDASMITVQLYLHDVPEGSGGATTFLPGERGVGPKEPFPCQPKAGSALLFTQNLLHEGSLVTRGLKYTLRTEAMYRPVR